MKNRLSSKLWTVLLPLAVLLVPAGQAATRTLRALDMNVTRGQTNQVRIVLDAQGVENSAAFSLCYDTNLLIFRGAVRGDQVAGAGAILSVNTSQALSAGRVGFTVALPAGRTLGAGSNAIVEARFSTVPGTNFAATAVAVCNQPVALRVNLHDREQEIAAVERGQVEVIAALPAEAERSSDGGANGRSRASR